MGNEDLNTILEKESDEFIKSSVEDFVLIPSVSEDIDDESLFDEDVLEDNVKIYSNSLFKFDDEYISSDVNPLFEKVLENIENKDSYDFNLDEPALLVTSLFDSNEDECFDSGGDIDEIDTSLDNDISTDIEDGYHDSEGDVLYLERLLSDDTTPNFPPEVFLDHDPRSLSDINDLEIMVKVFDPRISEKFFSPTYVSLPFKDRHHLFLTLAMSPDNAQSAVTYTFISSDSDGPSWGIPLMNAGEFLEMDPCEEVSQQGQVHPLSPAYVPDPLKLDEHAPIYVSEPEHPEYHAPSDDDIQVKDDEEDPEEDPSKEHEPKDDDEDLDEDPNKEHELEDEDTKEPSKGYDEIELFEEDETAITPPSRHHGARISVRPQKHLAASTQALIDAFAAGSSLFPLPPTSLAYDQAPLGHREAMISESSVAVVARAPRGQYDFVDTVEVGQGLIRSLGHDTQTIARAADRAKDVCYFRALQAFEQRMMTSIEEDNLRVSYQAQVRRQESKYFYTQLHDAQTDRRDIRLEIDVVRGQRIAYETELQEVHQAYLSFEARNRALLARLEILKTHMSHMEWQCQSAEDLAVTQMMCIHALKARARTNTVEDARSSC
nr:hypothetical protein [Tanacetum cinerariifolium]